MNRKRKRSKRNTIDIAALALVFGSGADEQPQAYQRKNI